MLSSINMKVFHKKDAINIIKINILYIKQL